MLERKSGLWGNHYVFIEEVMAGKTWNWVSETRKENQNEKDFTANNNSLCAPAQRS